MAEKVQAVPGGFHTLTPHLIVRDADRAIEFYQKAFGAGAASRATPVAESCTRSCASATRTLC